MSNHNPSPETRFSTDREEPLTENYKIRVTKSMRERLRLLGDRHSEFTREAIKTALDNLDKNT
jgi:hypothetical protein